MKYQNSVLFHTLQIAIIAALVAAVHAEAEADPAVLYANAYSSLGHYGYGYGLGAYGYGAGYYGGYAGYGLGHYGAYAGYYGYPYGAVAAPTVAAPAAIAAGVKSAPCVNAANVPVPCAARKRRDAEAEADPAVLYGGYYGYPGAYNRFAYGYGYGLGAYGYAGLGGYYGGYYGVHPSHYGLCHNVKGEQVPC